MDHWICDYCDNRNSYEESKCNVCESENVKARTKSNSCSNLKSSNDIEKCRKTKTDNCYNITCNKQDVKNNPTLWKCKTCTMLNPHTRMDCETCGECCFNKDTWACDICTMINNTRNLTCMVCMKSRPITLCPSCNKTTIHNIGDVLCQDCTKQSCRQKSQSSVNISSKYEVFEDKKGNYNKGKQTTTETWTCLKCTFVNSSNLITCCVCEDEAPHINKWSCGHCTLWNNDFERMCSACGFCKLEEENTEKYVKKVYNDDDLTTESQWKTKKSYDESKCLSCKNFSSNSKDQLCTMCKKENFICPSIKCRQIVKISDKKHCYYCSVELWQCSWNECKRYNIIAKDLCEECCCFRDVTGKKRMCNECGWISISNTTCSKCGYNL